MDIKQFFVTFSTLFVFITAENKVTKHVEDPLHEKSHQSKVQHEKSQNHYHIFSNRHKSSKSENQHHNFIYRDGNEKCSWMCHDEDGKPSSNSLGLHVEYNGNNSLIAIINKSFNIGLVLDGHNNVTAIVNGAVTVVIDINTKLIYLLSHTQAVNLQSGFDAYFKNLSSLQSLLNAGQQSPEKYSFSSVNSSVLGDLSSLGLGTSCSLDDLKDIFSFTTQLERPLRFIYQDKGYFNISKSIQWFVSLNLAIAKLFEDLQPLHNVQFDLQTVFNASSGLEALLSLLSQIGKHEDLSKLLVKYLRSPDELLSLIFDISKGSNDGVDGLTTVLVEIINLLARNGRSSMNDVISSLMNYNPDSQGNNSNLSQIINETLELIRSQNTSFQNFPAFEGIFNILTSLNNNNLIWNSLNISDLIKLLRFQNPREVLQAVMKILSQFLPPQLMNYIKNMPDYQNILQSALHGNFSQILSNGGNITSLLSNSPVLSDIVHQISSFVENGFNIGHYLNSSSILGYFNNILGGNLTHGPIGNMITSFTNDVSQVESGIEHGISSFLKPITGGLLGTGSGNANASESHSGITDPNDAVPNSTKGLKLDGPGETSQSPLGILNTIGNGSTLTGSLERNNSLFGLGHISSTKEILHGRHNLHEKKENKLHPNFQDGN